MGLEVTSIANRRRIGKLRPRLVGLAALLVVGLAACGGGGSAAAAPPVTASVIGQLAQISGSSLLVTDSQSRDTNVTYSTATVIETSTAASIADLVPGVCVAGTGAKDASGQVSVRTVQVSSPAGGKCAVAPAAGFGRGPASPRPGGASPNPARSPGGQPNIAQVSGLVTAVTASLLTVKSSSGAVTNAVITPALRVTKLLAFPSSDLKVGDCLLARGSTDASSAVKADTITVSQPGPQGCFGGGFGGGRQRGAPSPSPTG